MKYDADIVPAANRSPDEFTPTEFIDHFGVTRQTWFMFILLSIALFFDGYDNMIVNFSLPSIQAEWGLSSVVTGSLSSWSLLGLVAGGIIAGPLADRFGRKSVMVLSIALFGLLNLPIYFASNWEVFAMFRVLSGIGLGACIPIVNTMFSEWMPKKKIGVFIASGMAFMVLGGVVAGMIGNALCNSVDASQVISGAIGLEQISHTRLPFLEGEHIDGWRIGFFIGAFPLLYALLIHFAIPETPQFYAAHDQKGKCISQLRMYEKKATGSTELIDDIADGGIVFPTKAVHKSSPRELFSKRFIKGTLAIWIGYFCGCFMVYSMNAWLPRMCGSLGYDYTLATIMQAASVIANVSTGLVADRIGLKRNVVIGFTMAFAVVIFVGFAFMGRLPYGILIVAMVLLGFGINYGQTGLQPLMPATYPVSIRGTGVAWCQAFGRFGGAVGPIILGLVLDVSLSAGVDTTTSLSISFTMLAIPAAIAAVSLALLARKDA